jgi:hypothetical protein
MSEHICLIAALAVQLAVTGAIIAHGRTAGRRPGASIALVMLMIPVFGPIMGWMLSRPRRYAPSNATQIDHNMGAREGAAPEVHSPLKTVPIEEALFINDPRHRRNVMLAMLKGNPRKHLDVLMLARFNEDHETAHYATATLMKIQQQMQQELRRYRALIERGQADGKTWLAYLKLQDEYCSSGLLEGHLVRRERLMLASALKKCLAKMATPELFSMAVRNHLALGHVRLARETSREMYRRWPCDERSWLEMMRVCVQSRDRSGMNALLERALHAPVDWTREGRQTLKYWMKRSA